MRCLLYCICAPSARHQQNKQSTKQQPSLVTLPPPPLFLVALALALVSANEGESMREREIATV